MNPLIFRLYDVRGRYPNQLNEKEVFDVASRLKAVFGKNKKIVVGHDCRKSSPSLYSSLSNGLKLSGFKVVGAGLITYPMIYFLVRRLKTGGGIMITASHNPKEFNGLKIIDASGKTLGGLEVFGKIKNQKPASFYPKKVFRKKADDDFQSQYARQLNGFFTVERKIKAVIDGSEGTAGPILKKLSFPSKIKPFFSGTVPDGNFPSHGPDPTRPGACRKASKLVKKLGADIGVVFDGDGDRAVFLDNNGRQVRPEQIWRLLASRYDFPRAVCTVVDRFYIDILLKDARPLFKANFKETKVGHLFVRKSAKNRNADISIEPSAHYYFKEDQFSGSGILAMIKVFNALSAMPYKLSDFVRMLPPIRRIPELNKKFSRKELSLLYSKIKRRFSGRAKEIYFLDGISALGDGWWFNLRPSNTEDVVRINIEALDKKEILSLKKELLEFFK